MSFTDPFGGSTIQAAQVAYRAVSLTADTTLTWPSVAVDANYVARIMYVTPSGLGLNLTMPDATAVSPGFDVIFVNPSAFVFEVKDNAGSTICMVPPGETQYVYLRANTTAAGAWSSLQFASLMSAATAASLIGPGIGADGGILYAAQMVATFSANYTVLPADRTKVFVWTGGVGTLTLPLAATVGNDYFVSVSNQGTGALTVTCAGADTVDGDMSTNLLIGESFDLHSGGATAWYSVGRGRSTQFNFTLLSKTITTGNYTLTNIEASNVVQKYVGVLVANVTVTFPSTVQVYYVSNQTSGSFSVTFKTAGVGTTVVVPTGQNAVLFCDGLNVINAATTVSGLSALILNPGSEGAPSLAYTGDLTTGLYQPTSGSVATTISGVLRFLVNAAGAQVTGLLTLTGNLTAQAAGRIGYLANADVSTVAGVSIANYGVTVGGSHTSFGGPGLALSGYYGMIHATGGLERMRLSDTGNLTINAPTSGATLTVAGSNDTLVADFDSVNSYGRHVRMPYLLIAGSAANGYPGIGYNGVPKAAGTYTYAGTDYCSLLQFTGGGFQFLTAPLGTVGNTISLGNVFSITQAGNATLTGNLTLSAGNLVLSTGFLSAVGGLVGNLTGNITGNAATATALATPRNINGVAFDGTANITVAAAAGTLTGSTLAPGVTASSLTSVGTLANLTVTNPITGSVSGNAATASSVAWAGLTGVPAPVSSLSGTNTGDQTNISGNAATASSVAWAGLTGVPAPVSSLSGTNTGDQTNISGNAATATSVSGISTFGAGTYTPTLTSVSNIAASTAYKAVWMRVGNIVHVSGQLDVDPTAAGGTSTALRISLPVASNFAATEDLSGNASAASAATQMVGALNAETATDTAYLFFPALDGANNYWTYTFTYQVI